MFSHAFSREISLPRTDAERYHKQARAAVGLTSAEVSRLRHEHAWMRPCTAGQVQQRANEVVDIDERLALMRRITKAYVGLHRRAPEQLLWAAFAAIALNDGVRPAAELAVATARVAGSIELGEAVARMSEDSLKCAFATNFAIYMDLAWLHHAYLDGGIEVIRSLHEDGEIASELLAGFEDIHRGSRLDGELGQHLVAQGNLALFRHEQRVVVTPIFEKYAAAMAEATKLGLIAVPNRELAAACLARGRQPQWLASLPDASYAPCEPRWTWLVEHAWRPFRDAWEQGALVGSVERAAAVRSEHLVPGAQVALRFVQSVMSRIATS